MGASHTLRACAYRDTDGWWTIDIPDLKSPGPDGVTIVATGAATNWRGIDKAAHELAAVWLDVDEDDVVIDVEVVIPENVAQLWKEGSAAETEAAMVRAAALRRDAVRALRSQGYPLEAVAAALGVSRQRVQQLEKTRASA